jgi:uncharacterized protein (TIGR02599 family)
MIQKTADEHRFGLEGKKFAFTLVEVMASLAILSILMVLLSTALSSIQGSAFRMRDKSERHREARVAFDNLERRISLATLNTYWGYDNPEKPTEYAPQSELHFVCDTMEKLVGPSQRVHSGHGVFFQAPFGYGGEEAGDLGGGKKYNELDGAMNCWGYYVEFNSDSEPTRPLRPDFLSAARVEERSRFRLMEFRLPSEKLPLFKKDFASGKSISASTVQKQIYSWFADETIRVKHSVPVADNIVALFLVPRAPGLSGKRDDPGTAIAPAFLFDSRRFQWEAAMTDLGRQTRHQVPPVIDLVLIAVTETSWLNFAKDRQANQIASLLKIEITSPQSLAPDLQAAEKRLSELKLDYRIFTTTVSLRTGKWITSQSQ